MSDIETVEIEMDCVKCGRYSTSAICPACAPPRLPTESPRIAPSPALVAHAPTPEQLPAVIAAIAEIQAAPQPPIELVPAEPVGVGYSNAEGYITAIRNGVVARTHASYLETLRVRYGYTTATLAALNLPGPFVGSTLPSGPGIVHDGIIPTRGSLKPFIVGPKSTDIVEAAPVVKLELEHGTMIAGAIAEGHGVLVGWSGKGKLTRGALVDAIEGTGIKPPVATSARAQAGRVMSALTASGLIVRVARDEKGPAGTTMWTVGKVNHRSAVGSELGSVEMRATLTAAGELVTEGNAALGEVARTQYRAAVDAELYQAADVTGWLGQALRTAYDAVRFGVGWYVPARHAEAAGKLCAAVSAVFGCDWIVPALPVATSDQLRDGIVRGLTSEVDALMARMATERATADAAAKAKYSRGSSTGDIGPKRAGTFLVELRAIGARIVAYGQVLGEERLACAKEQVRQAVIELETVLGDDYSGISARFAGVWDEIELDRKRSGGVL